MAKYYVFGGVLESALAFPELVAAPESAMTTWTVLRSPTPPADPDMVLVAEDMSQVELPLRLYAASDRMRLTYGPLGTFDVDLGGAEITWYAGAHDCEDCARQCMLGRVLALALQLNDDFCLHGSCVDIGGQAVAFIAAKGTGKSTLASALVARGASLITDDMLRLDIGHGVLASAGVQRLRLHSDSADVANAAGIRSQHRRGGKHVTTALDRTASHAGSFPLAAIYLLEPVQPDSAIVRRRITGPRAVMTLLSNAMLGPLFVAFRDGMLTQGAELARQVPVYALEIPRAYDQLRSLALQLLSWHTAARESACGGGPVVLPTADGKPRAELKMLANHRISA